MNCGLNARKLAAVNARPTSLLFLVHALLTNQSNQQTFPVIVLTPTVKSTLMNSWRKRLTKLGRNLCTSDQ